MSEFAIVDALRERGERVARAVLVRVDGGSARRLGASLWVAADGTWWGGVTLGGCIEEWIATRARQVLAGSAPARFRTALGGEGVIDPRLGCAGEAEIQVDVVDFADPRDPLLASYDTLCRACAGGRSAVLGLSSLGCPIVLAEPGEPGVNGPASVLTAARRMLARKTPRAIAVRAGDQEWLLDLFCPPALLLVFGAGAIGVALSCFASAAGFRVWIVDSRAELVTAERFPGAERRVAVHPQYAVEALPWEANTYAVVTSHNPADEVPVLAHAVRTPAAFVGFVGSRERGARVLQYLADMGEPAERLSRVRVPVGLAIDADTPEEIAISIVSELVSIRNAPRVSPVKAAPPSETASLVAV